MQYKEHTQDLSALLITARKARYHEIVLAEQPYILERVQAAFGGRTVPTVLSEPLMKLTTDISRRHATVIDRLVASSYLEYRGQDEKYVRAMQELLAVILARLAVWGYQVTLSQDRRKVTLYKIPIV